MMESGPVGGIIASARFGQVLGQANVISFDMGGTTAKASLVKDGEPTLAPGYYVGGYASGHPVMLPMIDVVEVGAGGGSIAWIDEIGALKVGPQSAGAAPGPICYRGGGTEPTITDANVVLGRLDPDNFLGGTMKLDADGARAGVERVIAKPLGMDTIAAAKAIVDIARRQDVARGARGVGREGLRSPRFRAGRFGRRGAAARDGDRARAAYPDRDRAAVSRRTSPRSACCSPTSATISCARSMRICRGSTSQRCSRCTRRWRRRRSAACAHKDAARSRRSSTSATSARSSRCRCRSTRRCSRRGDRAGIRKAFDALYEHRYQHSSPDEPVEVVNVRVAAIGQARAARVPEGGAVRAAPKPARTRPVYLDDVQTPVVCPVYERDDAGRRRDVLGPGDRAGARHDDGDVPRRPLHRGADGRTGDHGWRRMMSRCPDTRSRHPRGDPQRAAGDRQRDGGGPAAHVLQHDDLRGARLLHRAARAQRRSRLARTSAASRTSWPTSA